ncbi:MAG: hypothetical protein ACRCTX_10455 [Afipia sp.]
MLDETADCSDAPKLGHCNFVSLHPQSTLIKQDAAKNIALQLVVCGPQALKETVGSMLGLRLPIQS